MQEAAAIGVPHPVKGDSDRHLRRPAPRPAPRARSCASEVEARIVAELGQALKPEAILFVADLPKTRNAKVMRRVIRAKYLGLPLGDTIALENPAAVEAIGKAV